MRFFFKHLYTTIAWAYDLVAAVSSIGQWTKWQHAGIEKLPKGRILEIGHGTGRVQHALSKEKREIYGIDPSQQMSRITSRRLKKNQLPINLCRARAQNLPFPKESFHSLLATFPSDFIFREDTFKEAWRVLKINGEFIIIPGVSQIIGWKGQKNILGLLDEAASLLYRLTGEAIEVGEGWKENFKEDMFEHGFMVEVDLVQQERAVVQRIIARKLAA